MITANTMLKCSQLIDNYIVVNPHPPFTDLYEDGKLIILTDMELKGVDYNLIYGCTPEQRNHIPYKKAKSQWLLSDIPHDYSKHVLYNFYSDLIKGRQFLKQIKNFNELVYSLALRWFPKYKIVDRTQWTWRFQLTENENYHVDGYIRGNHESHNLRIFYNLDSNIRIWRVGERQPYFLKYLDPQFNSLHPNEINIKLNAMDFWKDQPFHEINIPPKSFLLCNTQIISHQIVWGRKLAAYTFLVDPLTMNDPSKSFVEIIRQNLNQNLSNNQPDLIKQS